jgi:hypothetical protein
MRVAIGLLMVLVLTPALALAAFDEAGEDATLTQPPHDNPGDPCGLCPDPIEGNEWGLAYRGGDLWEVNRSIYTVNRLDDNCQIIESITLAAPNYPLGLGWDATRQQWIADNPSSDIMMVFDANGAFITQWSTAAYGAPGPVGVTYDSTRDLYCTCCWETNGIYRWTPDGVFHSAMPAPAGTRLAGLGYDAHSDAYFYCGRDQGYAYWIDAETGALILQAPIPDAGGNNGRGGACDPDGSHNAWVTHYEMPNIYCLEGLGVTATESVTWGALKGQFK